MDLRRTQIPGCFEVIPRIHRDLRGSFTKFFQASAFQKLGLPDSYSEGLHSVSHKGVIRGLHFQLPPTDQAKLVYCVQGKILDVALDLRVGSPAYLKHTLFELCAERGNLAYIPRGMAHGFQALSDTAVVVYMATGEYAPGQDTGVRWDTAGIPWVDSLLPPVLSDRDQLFVPLEKFESPFRYADDAAN